MTAVLAAYLGPEGAMDIVSRLRACANFTETLEGHMPFHIWLKAMVPAVTALRVKYSTLMVADKWIVSEELLASALSSRTAWALDPLWGSRRSCPHGFVGYGGCSLPGRARTSSAGTRSSCRSSATPRR